MRMVLPLAVQRFFAYCFAFNNNTKTIGGVMKGLQFLLCAGAVVFSGVIFAQQPAATTPNPDPLESLNRKIFAFNETADRWILKPVAKGYQKITPDPVEKGIGNVFSNLFEVTTIVNGLLQGKLVQAGADTGRFLINSTVGVVGIFDVASKIGLEKNNEDFGQTLGYWGIGPGPYLVVPLFGPYTLRDGIGDITQAYSTGYVNHIDHPRSRNQFFATDKVNQRAELLKAEELVSGDRYTFIRDAYLQRREYLVKDGQVEDDFGDDEYGEGSFDDWDEL